MRIVTVCEYGLNRSVTAKWLLQFRDHEVIPAGVKNLSEDTLDMLFDWAELVILLDARYHSVLMDLTVPADKILVWDVGPDRFDHHHNRELIGLLREHAARTDPSIWTRASTATPAVA
ncbi:MAG TPA: hypothetical protein VNG35_10595 [Gemmatimonadales bacterium]|nr:hypothetical protein [Gemmatimonadales bacterium]